MENNKIPEFSNELSKFSESRKLNNQIDELSLSLGLKKSDIEDINKQKLKSSKTIKVDNEKLDMYRITNLSRLINDTQSDNIINKYNDLKKNIAESTLHSKIDSTLDEDTLTDLIDVVNTSLDNTNQNFIEKIIEDDNKCPAQKINTNLLDCDDRKSYMGIHPDKNKNCKELANQKFKKFTDKCSLFQKGGSSKEDLYRVAQKISSSLQFSKKTNDQFNSFIQLLEIPEMSKTFDEIRNTIQSESIDKKIYNYQIGNSNYWSDKTKEKYEEFKKNVATLEILSIINKFKKMAMEDGSMPKEKVEEIIGELIDVINQTFDTNNNRLRQTNFENQSGGSNEKEEFKNYLKYRKYKEKYLILKLNN